MATPDDSPPFTQNGGWGFCSTLPSLGFGEKGLFMSATAGVGPFSNLGGGFKLSNLNPSPHSVMQAFQVCMPNDYAPHPPSCEATLLSLCTLHFHRKSKGNLNFGPKRCQNSGTSSAGEAAVLQLCTCKLIWRGGCYRRPLRDSPGRKSPITRAVLPEFIYVDSTVACGPAASPGGWGAGRSAGLRPR